MEEDQEQGHVCRFCKKHFACGRSLGGHMRSHIRSCNTSTATTATTSENKEKLEMNTASNGGSSSSNTNTNHNTYVVDFVAGGHVGYGLRENPKKTWRLSDSIDLSLKHHKYCKECGKGFQSSQALSGHMRSHSEKERLCNSVEEDDWWIDGNRKSIVDETETKVPRRRRRSRRSRYKNTTIVTGTAASSSSSSSFANASSPVSEIDQEQTQVANCLMMLSRDVRYWGGLNSVRVSSSDNNSAVLQVGSSGLVKTSSDNVDHSAKVKSLNDRKLNCAQLGINGGDSSFGCLRNGFNKLESVVSVDRSTEECKFKKPKCDGLEVSIAELGKGFTEEAGFQTDSKCGKRTRRESCNPKMLEESSLKKLKCGTMDSLNKYKCTVCNQSFHSFQALGGHRSSHKKAKGRLVFKTESSETSNEITALRDSENDSELMKPCSNEGPIPRFEGTSYAEASCSGVSLKKNRHQCGICLKFFASGQALGGHKRRHALESSEARGKQQTVIVQQQLPVIRDFLDLNLPAPVEEEANVDTGMKLWWVGSNHKHEQAVGSGAQITS